MNAKNIDIFGLFLLLWKKKKLIIRNCSIAFVCAVVVAYSIPKNYTAEVLIAPELSSGNTTLSGSLGSLAQMAGVNLGGLSGNEALYPEIYPSIVASTPFLTELLDLPVKSEDGEINTTLYKYLTENFKSPWWGKVFGIFSVLNSGTSDEVVEEHDIRKASAEELTEDERLFFAGFAGQLGILIDQTCGMITVQATMQDPLIAATVAQAVTEKLQTYVDNYRTAKEQKNVQYFENLYNESLQRYNKACQEYALYADSHQDAYLTSVKSEITNLENEMQLAYSIHTQIAQQLEVAKAKLQEKKPIFAIIQPAVKPIMASYPRKKMIAFTYVFLVFSLTAMWIFVKEFIMNAKRTQTATDAGQNAESASNENV